MHSDGAEPFQGSRLQIFRQVIWTAIKKSVFAIIVSNISYSCESVYFTTGMEKSVFTYGQKGIKKLLLLNFSKERCINFHSLQAEAHKPISEICHRLNREMIKHVALHDVAVIPSVFKVYESFIECKICSSYSTDCKYIYKAVPISNL